MPRRNIAILLALAVVSLLCYQKVRTNRFGRILANAYDTIERRSLDPVSPHDLFEGGVEGMIDRLGDPYSAYESPKQVEELDETLRQEFGGLGIQVAVDPKTQLLTVVIPLFDTPAQRAGILAGDKILRIDGRSTQGLSLQDAVAYLRGRRGERVTLSVLHEDAREPVDITVVRDIIQVATVLGDTRKADGSWNFFLEGHDRIGYVRIESFGNKTADELRGVIADLLADGMKGLVLDLRDDPGGLLDAAVAVCNMFVDDGVIVSIRGRDGNVRETRRAVKAGTFPDFPMAVLVNRFSASASEIVAACLQDHGRAVVVGQRTWGKGTVQEIIQLEDDQGALRLTTSSYWRPSGKNIHRTKANEKDDDWGVTPDAGYEVVVEGSDRTRLHRWRQQRDAYRPLGDSSAHDAETAPTIDRQLQRAVEYVEKAIGRK